MKKSLLAIVIFIVSASASAQLKYLKDVDTMHPHPRILLYDEDIHKIKETIGNNKVWADLHSSIISESDKIVELPVLERVQVGKRILDTSREALRRIFYLSYSYRITGEEKYSNRAEKEMLAVCRFKDWNPSHFLDVAEMTLAVAIGYDWLYNGLCEHSKETISHSIIKKGLDLSFDSKYNNWLQVKNNWNQVCNTGMTYGAIAVFEDASKLSKLIINRSIESIALPMQEYGPDGVYPEGIGYWSYGTSFNIMLLSAIEKLFGTDFGLSSIQGFLPSAQYALHMIAPSYKNFNYGDAKDPSGLDPAVFWFADKTKDLSLLWNQRHFMTHTNKNSLVKNRLFPSIMVWAKDVNIETISAPTDKIWVGQGINPVAAIRSSWTKPDAIYVGFKAGRAGVSHSHMDVGSFIMESDGVRWSMDLGIQSYNSLESVGIKLWDRGQNSQRWDVFRYNNLAHSTLAFDQQKQNVEGYCKIDKHGDKEDFKFAISDLSNAYKNKVKNVTRGVAIVKDSYVVIQDQIEANDKETIMRWSMITPSLVKIKNDKIAELTKNGQKLTLLVSTDDDIKIRTWSTKSPNSYDASNEGSVIVGFETTIPANSKKTFCVKLIPNTSKYIDQKIPALKEWE